MNRFSSDTLSRQFAAILIALSTLFCAPFAHSSPKEESGDDTLVDFHRQVLPLLSDRCLICHGPDEGTREADLRLDLPESAMAESDWALWQSCQATWKRANLFAAFSRATNRSGCPRRKAAKRCPRRRSNYLPAGSSKAPGTRSTGHSIQSSVLSCPKSKTNSGSAMPSIDSRWLEWKRRGSRLRLRRPKKS